MKIGYQDIKKIYEDKGYKFDTNNLAVNIFGIRMSINTNKFDDVIGVAYVKDGKEMLLVWPATTDPGSYWLQHPMNPAGTFILAAGQYVNCFAFGLHQGRYEAIVQTRPVKGYRDNNRNFSIGKMVGRKLKYESDHTETGTFGINLHMTSPYTKSEMVNKWSAGCQVLKLVEHFKQLLTVCRRHESHYGNKFTYTLFEKIDLYGNR